MASIIREPNGRKTIQFVAPDGKRPKIRLGKVSLKQAESVKVHVEQLVAALITGHAVADETARWVAQVDQRLADKLNRVGLVPKQAVATVGAFIDAYILDRDDVKPSTTRHYHQARRDLVAFFGSDRSLRDVTAGDAESFRRHLLRSGLGENTVRRRCGRAKQFFSVAVRQRLIPDNPFARLKSSVLPNPDRFHFIKPEDAEKVLAACPCAQWRLLFALGRYGGLRCPSEHLSLRWGDVDWEHDRITVRSPKTEHHAGGESRVIPLFPELRPYLEECFDLAEPGTEHVITRYRDTNANLRTQLLRIIQRAGLQAWPKLFQNLRSTRETELAEKFPMHVVCKWIGNSQPIAAKHYLQVTDDHFSKAVRNPVQQPAVLPRTGSQPGSTAQEKTPVLQGFAAGCEAVHRGRVPKRGLEPPREINPTRS